MAHYIEPSKRIQFVKARDEFHSSNVEAKKHAKAETRILDGKEIASFYRELIAEKNESDAIKLKQMEKANMGVEASTSTNTLPEISTTSSMPKKKRKSEVKQVSQEPLTERDERLWFKAAASNDLKKIKELLSRGMAINAVDFWGLTALICAAASGAEEVVEYFMEHQADWTIKNQTGFTAANLARRKGHFEIAEYIENFGFVLNTFLTRINLLFLFFSSSSLSSFIPDPSEQSSSTFCEHCNQNFVNLQDHHCSIVHIVNTSQPPRPGYAYGIPTSNVGYQLLKERGWTEAHGLGRQGEGRKYPLKTTLKRDRTGLGIHKLQPKVTHFEAGDLDAVKAVPKLGKRSWHKVLAEQKKREKAIENRVRRAVSDFDEYPV